VLDERKQDAYPQCEVCWIKENSRWEPDGVSENGNLVSRLTAVAVPLNVNSGEVNICCTCGEITVIGIYVEKYEDEVAFGINPFDIVEEPYS
jgi:hypothetical protein